MIVEMRTYTVKPQRTPEFLALYERAALELQKAEANSATAKQTAMPWILFLMLATVHRDLLGEELLPR